MDPVVSLAHFQLKYCERCGGLWLRPAGADSVYCPGCEQFMTELPLRARPARRRIIDAAASPATFALVYIANEIAQCVSGCIA